MAGGALRYVGIFAGLETVCLDGCGYLRKLDMDSHHEGVI